MRHKQGPGNSLTEEMLEQAGLLDRIIVGDPQAMGQVQQIRQLTWVRANTHIMEWNDRIDKVQKGDEFKLGVLKLVKVYIATRCKISVGDTATKGWFPRFY